FRLNENSLIITENAVSEPSILNVTKDDRLQFMRNAFFCLDEKTSTEGKLAFNRVVEMKSSYKPN
ncbi:MAG: glutamine--tRNA ligase, partial [Defluviitaleaceae bacterium]|nr:glutamine--tRNA ligase [Defluviitaleaceae bacterium]